MPGLEHVLRGRQLVEAVQRLAESDTESLESGTQQRYIQRLLGHAKSAITEIYTHLANRDLANVISPADTVFGGSEGE